MKSLSLVLAIVSLAGCVAPPPQPTIQSEFLPSEHEAYRVTGATKVSGQAFLRQRGGGTVTCAGAPVLLLPATNYFRDAVSVSRQTDEFRSLVSIASAYRSVSRMSQCDAQGNFQFDEIPGRAWLVVTEVRWTVGGRSQGGILERAFVAGSASSPLLLTDSDRF